MFNCKLSIPGSGRAAPSRHRGWTDPLGVGCRAEVTQPAVEPELVVLLTIVSSDCPTLGQGVEPRFRHSSRKRPWKLSAKPFCDGLTGSLYRVRTPFSSSHRCTMVAMNPGPLSLRGYAGALCSWMAFWSHSRTSLDFKCPIRPQDDAFPGVLVQGKRHPERRYAATR